MTLIDKKGKLFGIINLIDLIVLILLALLLPTLYFAYKLFTHKPELAIEERVLPVVFKKLDAQKAEKIKVGLEEINQAGEVMARLTAVHKVEPQLDSIVTGDGRGKIAVPDSSYTQLFADMAVRAQVLANRFAFRDIIFTTNDYKENFHKEFDLYFAGDTFRALVEVYNPPPPPSPPLPPPVYDDTLWLKQAVSFYQVHPAQLPRIKVGDTMVVNEKKIAKITAIDTVETDSIKAQLYSSAYTQFPLKRYRLRVCLDMLCYWNGASLIWNGQPMGMNANFTFTTDKYSVKSRLEPLRVKEVIEVKEVIRVIEVKEIKEVKFKIPYELTEKIPFIRKGLVMEDTAGIEISRIVRVDSLSKQIGIGWFRGKAFQEEISYHVYLTLNLLCVKDTYGWIFNRTPLKIGNTITVPFTEIDIQGVVLEIK